MAARFVQPKVKPGGKTSTDTNTNTNTKTNITKNTANLRARETITKISEKNKDSTVRILEEKIYYIDKKILIEESEIKKIDKDSPEYNVTQEKLRLLKLEREAIIIENGSNLVKNITRADINDAILDAPKTNTGKVLRQYLEISSEKIAQAVKSSSRFRSMTFLSAIALLGLVAVILWLMSPKETDSGDYPPGNACYQTFSNDKTQPFFTQVNCTEAECDCNANSDCATPRCDSKDGIERGVSYVWGDLSQLAGASPEQLVDALPSILQEISNSKPKPKTSRVITILIYVCIMIALCAGMFFGFKMIFHQWPPIPQIFTIIFTIAFSLVQMLTPR